MGGANFAREVIDRGSGTALLHVPRDGPPVAIGHDWLAERSSAIAGGLAALGLAPGDRVLVAMERHPDWFAVIFGCMKAGLVAMPGTVLLTADDIAFRLAAAGARAAIVAPQLCPRVPELAVRIVAGPARPGWVALDSLNGPDPGIATAPGDTALIYFTSGTTARPKMVPRDHAYAFAHAHTARHWMGCGPGDLHWTLTDTGWAKAAWGMLFAPLLAGATVVVHEPAHPFDPAAHLELLARLGVTVFCAPPTVYRMFAQLPIPPLPRLRRALGSGEPLNPEANRAWTDATGIPIADGYGQTEAICLIGNPPDRPPRIGSMGLPLPCFDIDVVDAGGRRLPAGETGHVALRLTDPWPPGLFRGYLTPEGPDRRAFRNGWYYTGDMARRDADGYFWFVGRADDVILSAGYRISPFEVESILLEHPAVVESAVVAAPDPVRGQIVAAHVVLAPGHAADDAMAEALRAHCRARSQPWACPRRIIFAPSLPKTISGKIRRAALRAG